MEENWSLKKQKGIEETAERLGKLGREIEERIDEDNMFENKMLEIATSLYCLSKDLRVIHHAE